MSLESIFAGVSVPYTVNNDGSYTVRAKRCMRKTNKSDNPKDDILRYILNNDGCNLSSLCRHTGCSRGQVKMITQELISQGRIRGEQARTGRYPRVLHYYAPSSKTKC